MKKASVRWPERWRKTPPGDGHIGIVSEIFLDVQISLNEKGDWRMKGHVYNVPWRFEYVFLMDLVSDSC